MTDSGSWHLIRQGGDLPYVVSGDVIVGRSKQADLRIEEGYVSRRHARLWLEAGRLMVEDLGSANGTFLNGERLATRKCLLPGDRICFDESEFYVEAPERSAGDPNATAHRPPDADDPEFELPERPRSWDAGATQPIDTGEAPVIAPETVPSVESRPAAARAPEATPPPPPPRRTEPQPPTEIDFDLDDTGFDLDDLGEPPAPPTVPEPAPRPSALRADTEPDFDLGLTGSSDFDLSIGNARPADSGLPDGPIPIPEHIANHPLQAGGTGTDVMLPEDAPQQRTPEPSGDTPGLLFLSGPEEGALYQLADGRLSIGRSLECDIPIEEASVSKRHAELVVQPGNCRLHDTSNSNGVYVNGEQVDDVALNPGDVIRLGRIELMFDSYLKLAEGGGPDDGVPWLLLVGSFVGTVALAFAAYVVLQFI